MEWPGDHDMLTDPGVDGGMSPDQVVQAARF